MQRVFAVWLCLALGVACRANIITVDDDGPADYTTIQAAIDASNNGDVVVVCPGTYTGEGNYDISFAGKAITVRSTDPQDQAVVAATTIDCEYQGRGFYFVTSEGANSVLDGLTITNAGDYDYFDGGGIYCNGSSPMVANCRILNSIGYFGGGVCNDYDSSPTLVNCVFSNNLGAYGGGMCNYESEPNVINCTFSGNTADDQGGGMYSHMSNPTVTNCTFSGNVAYSDGGGILNNGWSNTMVNNCILWGNVPDEIYVGTGTATVNYSDVQGGWEGEGNIDDDPLFVDADGPDRVVGTEDDNLRLSVVSLCIDAGDNSVVEPNSTDLDGNPRIVDGDENGDAVVDMGAYEFNITCRSADLNGDRRIDFVDFAILAFYWMDDTCSEPSWCEQSDYDHSYMVDSSDLAILCRCWLAITEETNLAGHWPMDDDADDTTVSDSSGNDNHGTAQQYTSVLHTDGLIGGALTFNGVSDYVDLGTSTVIKPSSQLSLACWLYVDELSVVGVINNKIDGQNSGYRLLTADTGVVYYQVGCTGGLITVGSSSVITTGAWHLIVATYDENNGASIYIDGVAAGSAAAEGQILYGTGSSYLGCLLDGNGNPKTLYKGKLDDIKIYDRVLTSAEILQLATDF